MNLDTLRASLVSIRAAIKNHYARPTYMSIAWDSDSYTMSEQHVQLQVPEELRTTFLRTLEDEYKKQLRLELAKVDKELGD